MRKNEKRTIIIVTSASILVYIVGIIIVSIICKDIEKVSFFSEIFSAFFVVGGVVVAMMQYIITSNEQISTRKRELALLKKLKL